MRKLLYSELSITRISLYLERFRRPQELPTQAFDSLLLETLYNSNGFQCPVDIRVIESSLYLIYFGYEILIRMEASNFALRTKICQRWPIFGSTIQILLFCLYSKAKRNHEIYIIMIFWNLLKIAESFRYALTVLFTSW